MKLIKLELSLSHPLERRTALELEVGGVCLFDTGDVWKVCRQVVDRLEAGASTSTTGPPLPGAAQA